MPMNSAATATPLHSRGSQTRHCTNADLGTGILASPGTITGAVVNDVISILLWVATITCRCFIEELAWYLPRVPCPVISWLIKKSV
ncbi:hypothetical protein CEXT_759811 [Caerostris extrusa]|uniref:Uncharacterized protein n=1 Tax=Caerostris extrusa TaxID=172846 RepID=A0AAV4MIN5_CAEEX|nr:hypothetical protein CEXT_759811 [Caerostris extrusa]